MTKIFLFFILVILFGALIAADLGIFEYISDRINVSSEQKIHYPIEDNEKTGDLNDAGESVKTMTSEQDLMFQDISYSEEENSLKLKITSKSSGKVSAEEMQKFIEQKFGFIVSDIEEEGRYVRYRGMKSENSSKTDYEIKADLSKGIITSISIRKDAT